MIKMNEIESIYQTILKSKENDQEFKKLFEKFLEKFSITGIRKNLEYLKNETEFLKLRAILNENIYLENNLDFLLEQIELINHFIKLRFL